MNKDIIIYEKQIQRQIYRYNWMYSKYLDYTDTAVRAHQAAQVQNDQKDILIGHLKNDLYQLRQLEGDYLRLNELIVALEDKYSLLLQEKERSEKEQRVKSEIDKTTIIQLKEQIDGLRIHLQKIHLRIEDLIRENTAKKRVSDSRAGQLQNLRYEIKSAEGNNERSLEDNRGLAITLKGLKDQRKRLQDECDGLSSVLDAQIAKLKNIQKNARNNQSNNARLDKTLHQAETDNMKLISELKQRNEEAKKAQNKLKGLRNSIQELQLTYRNLCQQAQKNKGDVNTNASNLQNELARGRDLSARIAGVQASIRAQQNQLDQIISEEERLRKEHFIGLDRNKSLNSQVDRLLALICEYESVNKELLDQIQIYSDQDEHARTILNRRQHMKQIIEGTLRKVALTGQPIKHLKY